MYLYWRNNELYILLVTSSSTLSVHRSSIALTESLLPVRSSNLRRKRWQHSWTLHPIVDLMCSLALQLYATHVTVPCIVCHLVEIQSTCPWRNAWRCCYVLWWWEWMNLFAAAAAAAGDGVQPLHYDNEKHPPAYCDSLTADADTHSSAHIHLVLRTWFFNTF